MSQIKSITIHKPDGTAETVYVVSKNKLDNQLKEIIAAGETFIIIILIEED